MTELPPDEERRENTNRFDIDILLPHANVDTAQIRAASGYKGRMLAGQFTYGILDGLSFVATQDADGHFELSLSFATKRPNNWVVLRAFTELRLKYKREESKATGKVRHFIVQRGLSL